jgi:CRP/FNR family transcriptional regulator
MPESPHWTQRFPGLAGLAQAERQTLEAASRIVHLPAGSRIFGPGQAPQNYLLLLGGGIRVSQASETGREIVLYRVAAGESCALTTVCLLGEDDYQAEAIAETDVESVAIPRATFDDMIARAPAFRRFVFEAFSRRVTDLCKLIDEVAFQRMDMRLAHKLVELTGGADTLALTHQQLATELGTAREVVSRQLHEFQRRGWVSAARGNLTILDRAAIERIAGSARGG